jgi:hypothetical protein
MTLNRPLNAHLELPSTRPRALPPSPLLCLPQRPLPTKELKKQGSTIIIFGHNSVITNKGLTLIIDKGNNSEENIQFGKRQGISFIGSFKPSHFPEFLRITLEAYKESVGP